MSSLMMRGFRRGLVSLAAGTIMGGAAAGAAAQLPPGAVVQSLAPDNGAELRGYLTALGNNPQSLDALIGAGRAALEMGDANAALTFFGRADEVSPRNARVKAGMGSALLQLGQPRAALTLFAEAIVIGAPEGEILADRGLGYDMIGDPRRAQQDYVAALRRRDDPELRRRLALSLAISGHRDAALRMIDPQLRRNDRAAWRTQAFILALTGDAAGAGRTAQAQMTSAGAQQMAPFFARLHALSPAQKAMAVHLGRFPSDGRAGAQTAYVDVSPDPGALALAGAPAAPRTQPPAASRPRSETTQRRSTSSRRRERPDPSDRFGLRSDRRPGRLAPPVARPQQPERRTEVAEVNTRWAGSPYPSPPQVSAPELPLARVEPQPTSTSMELPTAPPATPPAAITPISIPASNPVQPPVSVAEDPRADPAPLADGAAPGGEPRQDLETSASSAIETEPSVSIVPPASGAPSLADIAALVNALPEEPQQTAAPLPPPSTRTAEPTRIASARSTERRSPRPQVAQPADPSRHWVQIAGGIDRASLPREFARLRARAPEQLGRRTAFTAPLRTTSRLLVGPFASAREAQEFVNQLARHDVAAFAWTSAAGQEIERLAAR